MDEKKGEAILPEEPQTETAAEESPKGFTRRQVVAGGIGVGLVGLIAVAHWRNGASSKTLSRAVAWP